MAQVPPRLQNNVALPTPDTLPVRADDRSPVPSGFDYGGGTPRPFTIVGTGNSNALEIKCAGPAMLIFNDVIAAQSSGLFGADVTDYGALSVQASLDSPFYGSAGFIYTNVRNKGPFLYLPCRGKWRIRLNTEPGSNQVVVVAVGAKGCVIDFPSPEFVTGCLQSPLISASLGIGDPQVIAAATPTPVDTVLLSAPPSEYGILRHVGGHLSNPGANALVYAWGTPPSSMTDGHPLPAGASVQFPVGTVSMCTLYVFSLLGTTIYYQPRII